MRREPEKKDYRFLIVISALLVLSVALTYFLERFSSTYVPEPAQLPEEAEIIKTDDLIISEVLVNNGGVYISEDGLCCDFVEIYNGGSETLNLQGYGLSDRDYRVKWAFPDVDIEAGGYLVVNLTGKEQSGLNASFKLASKGSEELVLVNRKGKVIDALKIPALGKNQSLIRSNSGWVMTDSPTPGFENSESGLEGYRASLIGTEGTDIVLNELLCKNSGNYRNEFGRFDGFIELMNVSDGYVSMSDYYISNDISSPFKMRLPDYILAPGEIYFMYTGDNSYSPSRYTGFSFQNRTGSVFISSNGKIVSKVDYENLPNGSAYVRYEDGTYYMSSTVSPGYANTAEDTDRFQKEYMPVHTGLLINEVMTSNNAYLPQNGYKFYDWIELFNNSSESVDLSGYCLTTDISDPGCYALPGEVLEPGEYIVIMCSGNTALSNDRYHHAGFKLGNSESVFLTKDGKVEDFVYTCGIPLGSSYSRGKQYGWLYTSKPTPGSANGDGIRMISPSPVIETEAGIYDGVSSVSVSISGSGNIYYTTDGSDPTAYSRRYTGPIDIYRTTVIKAVSVLSGAAVSSPVCSSYILNDPHRMPVISVSLNPWEYNTLYDNFYSNDLVYKANFELFEDGGGVSSPCGINISGKSGTIYTKKSYGIKFEGEYGAKNLDYRFFDNLDCSSFDNIVLRGGSNAEMSLPWKDEFASALADEYLLTRKFKTCALYINGNYKGIFNAREKITPNMIANNYNVDKSLVNISRWENTLEYGENVWKDVKAWSASHNLSSDENYYEFCRMIDVEELCDLWIFQMYMNNPDIYNIRVFSHPDIDDGRCKFIFFDLDLGFYGPAGNYLSTMTFNPSGYAEDLGGHKYDVSVNLNLLRNERFRRLFLERLSYHLHNSLSTENALALFDYFTELYAPEIARDLYINGYSTDWYYSNINEFRWLIVNRSWTLMSYAQSFFGLSNSEMKEIFGDLW